MMVEFWYGERLSSCEETMAVCLSGAMFLSGGADGGRWCSGAILHRGMRLSL